MEVLSHVLWLKSLLKRRKKGRKKRPRKKPRKKPRKQLNRPPWRKLAQKLAQKQLNRQWQIHPCRVMPVRPLQKTQTCQKLVSFQMQVCQQVAIRLLLIKSSKSKHRKLRLKRRAYSARLKMQICVQPLMKKDISAALRQGWKRRDLLNLLKKKKLLLRCVSKNARI